MVFILAVEPGRQGTLSQTLYSLRGLPETVKVTRRHHPLLSQAFPVLRGGREQLVIRLADGSAMNIPRVWTDVDGAPFPQEATPGTQFTVVALRELVELVDVLLRSRD